MMLLFRRCPSFMRLKEDYMMRKLEFFRDKVGVGPREMLRNAWVLMLSLETRLMPRYELMKGLKERGLDLPGGSMCKAFAMNHLKFENSFVNRFEDGEGSDLVKGYRRSLAAVKKVETSSESSS
ncbi:uncharacterized protein A4U43_C07F35500 [Asparagus officinalis]|uniref:Uncharacterized protein n=1 Tax=Asparagus officinalis TaxID=4686 RepID=A0A5P1EKF3_ASPOF|nr:uncharacterized protein A4U43_C07F35500 [Asparagus officinalis]